MRWYTISSLVICTDESKVVTNNGIYSSTVGRVIRMDIVRIISGIFFPVTHECEQARRRIFKNIQRRDLIQRRELGLYGGGGSSP